MAPGKGMRQGVQGNEACPRSYMYRLPHAPARDR